jgi:hypothetical protein
VLISFFSAPLLALLWCAGSPPPPARCSYAHLPAASAQLLQRIDRTLPPLVRSLQRQDQDHRLPYVEVDSCFHAVILPQLFGQAADARMRQGLGQLYYKEMGEHFPQMPQAASLLVLAYASEEAATLAEHVQDSLLLTLQHRCRGRIKELEPCVSLDRHRFTRLGSHLLHYNLYAQDPIQRANLQGLAAALTSALFAPEAPTTKPRRRAR